MSAIGKFFADVFLGAFGDFLQGLLTSLRSEKAQRDVGRLTAERDQAKDVITTQQAELDAAINAPKTTDDAIARLEGGTA